MATSEFWQRLSASPPSAPDWAPESRAVSRRRTRGTAAYWMAFDAITILASVVLANYYELRTGPIVSARGLVHGTIYHGQPTWLLLGLLCEFIVVLLYVSRHFQLYAPIRLSSLLHEQRLSVQSCFTAGLLLTGSLYLARAPGIPRSVVLLTVGLVTIALSLRRAVYRILLYRQFNRGVGTRNVLIIGTGPEAHALRHHIGRIRRLGYTFKGFISIPGYRSHLTAASGDVLGSLDGLFEISRQKFIDEIFFTMPCERRIVQDVLEQARRLKVDLRVVPDMYDGMAWGSPIEYIGQFPTIPLHHGRVPELGLLLKRSMDICFAGFLLLLLSPLMLAVAIAVKLDSPGPVFYYSDRIGKKGRLFRCTKFRTMVRDAEIRRADVLHMNERDGVLFKIGNDPRITRLGRFLRKYSIDELPQFFNVLRGDMSVVGPRPPLKSEVREYKLNHLRRLDVTPGVTGLWQVQGRQDPSFDSYISLDVAYIENWSIWLDLKIVVRTIGVVFSGTGT